MSVAGGIGRRTGSTFGLYDLKGRITKDAMRPYTIFV